MGLGKHIQDRHGLSSDYRVDGTKSLVLCLLVGSERNEDHSGLSSDGSMVRNEIVLVSSLFSMWRERGKFKVLS